MSTPPTTVTKRSRPSMASYLRDSDEPILISTTFPKKVRPTTPPTSLRTTSTPSSTSPAIHFRTSDATLNTDRPLVGLLVKLNGEEIPFLIPRPTRPFRLPEATPYRQKTMSSLFSSDCYPALGGRLCGKSSLFPKHKRTLLVGKGPTVGLYVNNP